MTPITQTKVVVKNSKGEVVIHGNCYAAAIASMIDLPISEVPNVEVFFHLPLESSYWNEIMLTFLNSKGWELCADDRFRVFHDGTYGVDKGKRAEWLKELRGQYYFVTGKSPRDVSHICIYKNGKLAHDPHPTREGLITEETFQTLEDTKNKENLV
jgi:hypothetical protein